MKSSKQFVYVRLWTDPQVVDSLGSWWLERLIGRCAGRWVDRWDFGSFSLSHCCVCVWGWGLVWSVF